MQWTPQTQTDINNQTENNKEVTFCYVRAIWDLKIWMNLVPLTNLSHYLLFHEVIPTFNFP
jgi:hypothetical protein